MGKKFKDIKFGDTVYVVSVFVFFSGRGDNSDDELMIKIEGIYPMLLRYNSSGISTFFVNKIFDVNEYTTRLLLSNEKMESENEYSPQTAKLMLVEMSESDKNNDFIINRKYDGSITIYSTSIESLRKCYLKVIDAFMASEANKSNRRMSSLMELKTRKL
jgi:hypothetical protein